MPIEEASKKVSKKFNDIFVFISIDKMTVNFFTWNDRNTAIFDNNFC